MKKMILAAVVLCTAVLANAAAVDWTASAIVDPVATAAAGKNTPAVGWLGYCILGADLDTVTSALANGDVSALTSAAISPAKTTSAKGAFTDAAATGNVAAGLTDFYLVVLNAATTKAATSFYVSAAKSVTVEQSLDTLVAFGSQAAGTKVAANWTSMSVPEPTSGLLLLLGMAGLALKRKRA